MKPRIGDDVIYRTDGRNGLVYDLAAKINCTQDTHPGNYPDGRLNPLPVPQSDQHVHLTVFTPGGFGSVPLDIDGNSIGPDSKDFIDAYTLKTGSGTYVEWDVPFTDWPEDSIPLRTWRYHPERTEA